MTKLYRFYCSSLTSCSIQKNNNRLKVRSSLTSCQSRSSHLRVSSSLTPFHLRSNITLCQTQDNNLTFNQCHNLKDSHLSSDTTYFNTDSSVSNNVIGINSYQHDVPPHETQDELVSPENSRLYSPDVNSYELGVIFGHSRVKQ